MLITKAALPAASVLGRTTSLCGVCKEGIPAEIVEADGKIVLRVRARS